MSSVTDIADFPETDNIIHESLQPLSALCSLFGFYVFKVENKNVHFIITIYCWLITTALCVCWAVFTIMKLSTEFVFSFLGVTVILLEMTGTMTLTYYRIRYLARRVVLNLILDNINYVDESLERMGIKVAHTSNRIKCTAYTCLLYTSRCV